MEANAFVFSGKKNERLPINSLGRRPRAVSPANGWQSRQSKALGMGVAEINGMRGGGQPLSDSLQAFFAPRFGHDLGHVRVHTDSRAAESARAVNARAYATGRDVVFGAGQYQPGMGEGQRLLARADPRDSAGRRRAGAATAAEEAQDRMPNAPRRFDERSLSSAGPNVAPRSSWMLRKLKLDSKKSGVKAGAASAMHRRGGSAEWPPRRAASCRQNFSREIIVKFRFFRRKGGGQPAYLQTIDPAVAEVRRARAGHRDCECSLVRQRAREGARETDDAGHRHTVRSRETRVPAGRRSQSGEDRIH